MSSNNMRDRLAAVLAKHVCDDNYVACMCDWRNPIVSRRFRRDHSQIWAEHVADALLAALPELKDSGKAVREFVERVERRAEADMVAGNPLEGAHYRAMQIELKAVEEAARQQEEERA